MSDLLDYALLINCIFGITNRTLHMSRFLNRSQRLFLGCLILLLVDIFWVLSSEVTKKLYWQKYNGFEKPFFTTYIKSSLFMIYLLKFCYCSPLKSCNQPPGDYMSVEQDGEEEDHYFADSPPGGLSDATFVPLVYSGRSSGTESESEHTIKKHVTFSKLAEVRQLSDNEANEVLLARLSYQASLRTTDLTFIQTTKYNVPQVAKVAFLFSMLWFAAEYSFQAALVGAETGVVTVMSSSSSVFTLILSAMFPSNTGDKLSVSKCVTVSISICGLILVSISDVYMEHMRIPQGAILSLVSAMFYSLYTVFLRRQIEHEDKLDIMLFFGFVGLYNFTLLWPLFLVLHYNKWETFTLPDRDQWLILLLNGLIGTVISETLWLWGVFLTSSIIATVSISLTIPLSMLADVFIYHISYPKLFYIGAGPVFFAFFAIVLLAHFHNRDPVLDIIYSCLNSCWPYSKINRKLSEVDCEQSESLININMDEHDSELDHEA